MKLNVAVLPFLAGLTIAAVGDRCNAGGTIGTCEHDSWCDSHGGSYPVRGACPRDPDDVRCCIYPTCNGGNGYCMDTGDSWCPDVGGSYLTGYCPGPNNYKCCVY